MPDPDPKQAARESFNGRGLTETQFEKAWAFSAILHAEIRDQGSFRGPLTDYAHAFARDEKFDALRGEAILRDVFTGRYNQSMNQLREDLNAAQEALPQTAPAQALAAAERIAPRIQEGQTMPYYRALDLESRQLSTDLGVTQKVAKSMMGEAFEATHGRTLYEAGKDVETAFHKPVREAEVAAQKAEQAQARSQSMG